MAKVHLLYAVLNWGLGHASRSAPLIRSMRERGYQVSLASDGAALEWLREEFPELKTYPLPAYDIHYSRWLPAQWAVALQAPRIASVAAAEQRCLRKILKQEEFTALLSDNRLGCYSAQLPCVYLSHQFQLAAGAWTGMASFFHKLYWRKFQALAIPDTLDGDLAGRLGQFSTDPGKPVFRLGPLSHLAWGPMKRVAQRKRIVAILSGPEPQRSVLEASLLSQMKALPDYEWHLVRGVPAREPAPGAPGLVCYDRLGSVALRELLATAELVISRSGYSSIMDYAELGMPALLVPTPGQGEQEYLARYHREKGHAHAVGQEELDLARDIPRALEGSAWPARGGGDREALFRFLEGE